MPYLSAAHQPRLYTFERPDTSRADSTNHKSSTACLLSCGMESFNDMLLWVYIWMSRKKCAGTTGKRYLVEELKYLSLLITERWRKINEESLNEELRETEDEDSRKMHFFGRCYEMQECMYFIAWTHTDICILSWSTCFTLKLHHRNTYSASTWKQNKRKHGSWPPVLIWKN